MPVRSMRQPLPRVETQVFLVVNNHKAAISANTSTAAISARSAPAESAAQGHRQTGRVPRLDHGCNTHKRSAPRRRSPGSDAAGLRQDRHRSRSTSGAKATCPRKTHAHGVGQWMTAPRAAVEDQVGTRRRAGNTASCPAKRGTAVSGKTVTSSDFGSPCWNLSSAPRFTRSCWRATTSEVTSDGRSTQLTGQRPVESYRWCHATHQPQQKR